MRLQVGFCLPASRLYALNGAQGVTATPYI